MSIFKVCTFILFYFLSRMALASTCETLQGYQLKEKVCWNDSVKGWMSEKCVKQESCEANKFFKTKKQIGKIYPGEGGQNPAALVCHHLKLKVLILRDPSNNEQSFCEFLDKSIVDANAIERHVK